MPNHFEDLGPLEYAVYEIGSCRDFPAEAVRELLALDEAEIVRVVDLVLIRVRADGTVEQIEAAALDRGHPLAAFDGRTTEILTDADLCGLARTVAPGRCAIAVVLEHRWAIELDMSITGAGATVRINGPIDREVVARSVNDRSNTFRPRRHGRPAVIMTPLVARISSSVDRTIPGARSNPDEVEAVEAVVTAIRPFELA